MPATFGKKKSTTSARGPLSLLEIRLADLRATRAAEMAETLRRITQRAQLDPR